MTEDGYYRSPDYYASAITFFRERATELEELALLETAVDGDIDALEEIADRYDEWRSARKDGD